METLFSRHWHATDPKDAARFLDSSLESGLDQFETRRRQAHFGPNVLTPKKKQNPLLLFLQQTTAPARLAGNALLVYETLNQAQQPRAAAAESKPPASSEQVPVRASRFFVPGGPNSEYGINQTDDYEIPAILRKQMD